MDANIHSEHDNLSFPLPQRPSTFLRGHLAQQMGVGGAAEGANTKALGPYSLRIRRMNMKGC